LNGSTAKTVEIYSNKEVSFRFQGRNFRFALSLGLFSSGAVDRGSGLLLKALARLRDAAQAAGEAPPRRILDCGCGCGVIGICAAALVLPSAPDLRVRAQDRDELARIFTGYNALANGIPPGVLEARTEALLAGPPDSSWDLILSNIPAKAGEPALEDFIPRSLGLLNEGGKVLVVAVRPLEDFFRSRIGRAGGLIFREEAGPGHIVLGYARRAKEAEARRAKPVWSGAGFLEANPFYLRRRLAYDLEGISLGMDTVHGAPGFDRPGGAAEAAVKLVRRLNLAARIVPGAPVLFHEPGQGWFPAWFRAALEEAWKEKLSAFPASPWVLSGRNILALEAARHNLRQFRRSTRPGPELLVVPAVDPALSRDKLREAPGKPAGAFGFIAAFPEPVSRVDRNAAYWEAFAALLDSGGIVLAGLASPEAERLDRKKTALFTRLGDLRRNGFRALAYQRQ
jgi:hypothetical protein